MSFYFIIFSSLIILSSIMIIISANSITAVLFLISIFLYTSLCLLLLGAEFLSILIIIVYVGAISILFLFVIMMLNLRIVEVYTSLINYFPVGSFLGILFFIFFLFFIKNDLNFLSLNYLDNNFLELNLISNFLLYSLSNLHLLGDLLYNYYSFILIVIGLLLLLAMVGSMVLTIDIPYHSVQYKKVKSYIKNNEIKKRISFFGII